MKNLSLRATGVQVHDKVSGNDFGMHDECWTAAQREFPDLVHPFTGVMVAIGPLFADPSEWRCAYSGCEVTAHH